MKPTTNNKYGYKVCYKQKDKQIVTKFLAKSYKTAVICKIGYQRFPLELKGQKIKWLILPITHKEVLDGIWRQIPF